MPEFISPEMPFENSSLPEFGWSTDHPEVAIVKSDVTLRPGFEGVTEVPIVASGSRRPQPEEPAEHAAAEHAAMDESDGHPQAAADGGSQQPPPPGGEAVAASEDPPDRSPFEQIFSYMDQQLPQRFRGIFAAAASGEALGSELEPADFNEADDDSDSLAAYDRPATQRNDLQMDASVQYEAALEATGLSFGPDVFAPQLVIVDGERFAQAVAQVPEGDPELRDRVADVVRGALDVMAMTQIPSEFDEWHGIHLTSPGEDAQELSNNQMVGQVLSNVYTIAGTLENLDANPYVVAGLRSAHTAEVEGVLPLWAPYHRWGLDKPPTTRETEREWTQWLAGEDWEKFYRYVDRVAAEAPEGSRFARGMAETAIAHLQNAREGVYAESEHPSLSWLSDDDPELDELIFGVDHSPEVIAQAEAFAREYDRLLAAAQDRLRGLLS